MACINPNSPEFKAALERTGNPLLAEIEVDNRNIRYGLKATNALQSDKAIQLFNALQKNKVTGDAFWNKIQTDLQIPKEQIELLKQYDTTNREELITNLLADYSYTVEINVTTKDYTDYKERELLQTIENPLIDIETREEAQRELDTITKQKVGKPTQYYSNLTVPGGTNYTENEIATPAITPAIKGHAEFATDKGIGWFRSDEVGDISTKRELTDDELFKLQMEAIEDRFINFEKASQLSKFSKGSKTRRILELQSDLFQKGRERKDLISYKPEGSKDYVAEHYDNWAIYNSEIGVVESGFKTKEAAEKWLEPTSKENQFLQLLNKANNWVTFFVKSIIQDSAKKGYEKVLFPSGDTASKVEGHTTLEEFKKQKEDRIKYLEEKKKDAKYEKLSDLPNSSYSSHRSVEGLNNEIDQLKKELERVEKEGFAALKPIYNFYENTVTNILKKQGYTPRQITDEYGNTWNEVEIKAEREKQPIYLQKERQSEKAPDVNIDAKIKKFLASIGVSIKTVETLRDREGKKLDGIALADMLDRVIKVVNNEADITTLPEEAAHFFVELLGENHPLYKDMLDRITSYEVYRDTLTTYKDDPLYRNEDGTINFPKLKKEAMGKLIMQHIIQREAREETADRVKKAQAWWEKMWNSILKLFGLAQKIADTDKIYNPFEAAAGKILEGDISDLDPSIYSEEQYLQTGQDLAGQNFNKVKAVHDTIDLDDSIDPVTKKKRHIYRKDKQPIVDKNGNARSVNENRVKPWYAQKFPTDRRNETEKFVDDLKAEMGIELHTLIQDIFERYVDPQTGLKRKAPLTAKPNKFTADINDKLTRYVKALIDSYSNDTRFLVEARVYNQKANLPGTVDLIIFKNDGSVDIYDWKSQQIRDGETELKWFKEPAYRIQLEEYRKALEVEFGITKFGKIRAIPIRTLFRGAMYGGVFMPSALKDIEIGPIDPSMVPDNKEYLLPVVAETETTDDKRLDELISRLNSVYETLSKKSTKDKEKKNLELNRLKKTIRTLQVKKDIRYYVESGLIEIEKYRNKLDSDTIDVPEILQAIDIVNVFEEGSQYLKNIRNKIEKQIKDETDLTKKNELISLQNNLNMMTTLSKDLLADLKERALELGEKKVAEPLGVKGILNPERVMDYLKRNFRPLSSLPTAASQVLWKLVGTARQKRDVEVDKVNEELTGLQKELKDWAQKNGVNESKIFDGILEIDENGERTGKFLNIYSEEFMKQREAAIKRGDIKWIRDNMTFDRESYEKAFNRYKDVIMGNTYSSDPKKNKESQEKAIMHWIEMHNGEKSDAAAMLKKGNFLKPKDIWWSEKYKALNEPKNAPLKKVYDYFQKLLKESESAEMISYEFGFIPSIIKGKLEAFVFNDPSALKLDKDYFLQSLAVESSQAFGKIDVLKGTQIKEIPVYYTKELGKDKSFDLFKVFSIWATHTENYKAMSEIEEAANLLLFIEQNKGSLQTNIYGKVKKGAKPIEDNKYNAEVLEKYINLYVYGQKIDKADDFTFKIGETEISATKGMQKVLRFFSMQVLGLNVISGSANLVGGTVNASFIAKKNLYFGDTDWKWGIGKFVTKDEISMALIDYADPLLEDSSWQKSEQLSMSAAVANMTSDKLFILQRSSDKLVQYPVMLAMFRSHMVDKDGKIVSIREHVKAKNNFENVYNLPDTERKEVLKKIEEEIEELSKNSSLYAKSKKVNNKLVIEGVDRKSAEFAAFRNKIKKVNKKVLGNSTQEDINLFRTGMLGQAMMQFRSWIPELLTERFGDLSYDTDLETYNYGKARIFFKHFFDKSFFPLMGELITGFGVNTIERAKERYQEMKMRAMETGDLNFADRMSEAQFIEMYTANLRSMMRELLVMLAFFSLLMWAHSEPPDEDKDKNGPRKLMARAFDKYFNEVAFFYNPNEFKKLIKGSPLPVMSLFENIWDFGTHSATEIWAVGTGDSKLEDKSHPMKYFNRMIPVGRQVQDIFALFDNDFRKEMGIRSN